MAVAAKKQTSQPQSRAGSQTGLGLNPCSATCLVSCVTLPEMPLLPEDLSLPICKWA